MRGAVSNKNEDSAKKWGRQIWTGGQTPVLSSNCVTSSWRFQRFLKTECLEQLTVLFI